MPKRVGDDLASDEETVGSSSSGSEESVEPSNGRASVPEYEKQRLARIAENKARIEALGLPQMASSLMGSTQNLRNTKKKGKAKVLEDDDEYRPEEEGPTSSGEEEEDTEVYDDDDDDDYCDGKSRQKNKKKVQNLKKAHSRSSVSNSDYVDDDDDEALKQAIALSLQDSGAVNSEVNERKGESWIQQDRVRKSKVFFDLWQFASQLQMTEDELVLHFYQFDENGMKAFLQGIYRVATTHDFMWTDKEVVDMINLFDSDGDGNPSLEDFRKIALRCNIIKVPENS